MHNVHNFNYRKIEAVLVLEPPVLYSHFIKKSVGWGQIWGLYDNGWATTHSADGKVIFPMWSEMEYAKLMAVDLWDKFVPTAIKLDEVLSDMLPYFKSQNIHPGVFYRKGVGSITCTLDDLERDLKIELENYS